VKSHLEIILESMAEGILEVSGEQRIVYVNPAAVSMFGIPEETVLGMRFTELFGQAERETLEGLLDKMYTWSLTIADESPICLNNRLVSMSSAPFYDGQRKAIVIINDVTERKRAEAELHQAKSAAEAANEGLGHANQQLEILNKELQKLTLIDGLTGIGNRRHFDQMLEKEWRRCQRTKNPISLILADIDYFKDYNDRYGHLMGDDCLRKVATQMEACARRPGDLAARYGGEELALVLAGTPVEQAIGLAERARTEVLALKIPHETSLVSDFVTVSLGVGTMVPDNDASPQRLIATVDRALYKAKQTGRNRTMVVSPVTKSPQADDPPGVTA
jgi:two-component system, cell cycle response regulator